MAQSTVSPYLTIKGSALRHRRIAAGLSTRGLAAAAGLSQGYVWNLETGARERVSPPAAKRLLDALDLAGQHSVLFSDFEQDAA